ncbi:four-carbon acid sugar kinase family protein [Celerinatantimonas sp. YJH-8]|uniref:four-carbon acid sugar kinase family protein n=1 Tax=Celerinatantimonas sp. YJH-8 TaxID=3228714 RepID=UPI0038C0F3C3
MDDLMKGANRTHVLVIADDFTGANDVGMMLVRQGFETSIHLSLDGVLPTLSGATQQALVVNTDSRSVTSQMAHARIEQVMHQFNQLQQPFWLYKKIDSTLRGNIGIEIEAILRHSELPMAIVAPAFPDGGRLTQNGECWVGERRLTDTEFASDPKTPVNSSRISDILSEQTHLSYWEITLNGSLDDTTAVLEKARQAGIQTVIVDIKNNEQLQHLGRAIRQLSFKPLCVGSAGLSQYLFTPDQDVSRVQPMLAVVGSMSQIACEQIDLAAARKPVQVVTIDVSELFEKPWAALVDYYSQQITAAYQRHHHIVLHTMTPATNRELIEQFCQRKQLTRHQLGTQISAFLAQLVSYQVKQQIFSGLYLSGGDTALAVTQALYASHFHLQGDIAGFVPWGYLPDSSHPNLLIMTKSGAFGLPDTLLQVIEFIEEKTRE